MRGPSSHLAEPTTVSYRGHRFPPDVMSLGVWLYYRFPLNLLMVEEILAARGIVVTYETVRRWARKFGQIYAQNIHRRRVVAGDKWHLDEMVIKMNGRRHWLWRAVDVSVHPRKSDLQGPVDASYRIIELERQVAERDVRIASLERDVVELKDLVNTLMAVAGRNSHLPPSSDGPAARGGSSPKAAKRGRGGQPGHRGAKRVLLPKADRRRRKLIPRALRSLLVAASAMHDDIARPLPAH